MHKFHLNFTEGSIIIKYRSSSIKGVIRKIMTELWPFFDLDFGLIVVSDQYTFTLILLKPHWCFGHGLKICMWFGYKPQIIFVTFFTS